MAGVSYFGCSEVYWAVALMTLGVGFGGLNMAGFNVNHLDISPNYAGVLEGITNFGGTISGCIAPEAVGLLTENEVRIIPICQM